jgi:hypothetical protein
VLAGGAASASGPSGSPKFEDYQICKGGSNKGVDCEADVDCPGSVCVIDWVEGPGTAFNAAVTAIYDEQTRDWRNQLDTPYKAFHVIIELKAAGQTHMLAETYHRDSDPSLQPEVLGWGGIPFDEFDFTSVNFCNGLLYGSPDEKMADALRAIAGLPATKLPVVAKVKGNPEIFDHDAGSDPIATAVRCKVKIRFFNEP